MDMSGSASITDTPHHAEQRQQRQQRQQRGRMDLRRTADAGPVGVGRDCDPGHEERHGRQVAARQAEWQQMCGPRARDPELGPVHDPPDAEWVGVTDASDRTACL
jgi:hypothetical protein